MNSTTKPNPPIDRATADMIRVDENPPSLAVLKMLEELWKHVFTIPPPGKLKPSGKPPWDITNLG